MPKAQVFVENCGIVPKRWKTVESCGIKGRRILSTCGGATEKSWCSHQDGRDVCGTVHEDIAWCVAVCCCSR